MQIVRFLFIIMCLAFFTSDLIAEAPRSLPVIVSAEISKSVEANHEIPLTIRISNNLKHSIRVSGYTLPNEWHAETVALNVLDIFRDDKYPSIYLSRPVVNIPPEVSMESSVPFPSNVVEAGKSLEITTDLRKWKVTGGWVPGKYQFRVRVEGITVDDYTKASVLSDPVEFRILEK